MAFWNAKSMSKIGIRVLAILFAIEGLFYVTYTVWNTILNRLEFYRAPPLITPLAYAFFLVMLGVGVYFICRAFILPIGGKRLPADYYVSIVSFYLWIFPALFSFGNARTYFATAPLSLRPVAYAYLTTGIIFTIIGVLNILSLVYMSGKLEKIRKGLQRS
jgi:uncharacterized membrane protein